MSNNPFLEILIMVLIWPVAIFATYFFTRYIDKKVKHNRRTHKHPKHIFLPIRRFCAQHASDLVREGRPALLVLNANSCDICKVKKSLTLVKTTD